ncbi:S41 family peptidase [Microbulbifer variabilis]|uniref:S41 family peptidase n=1 Tax=Microbulbifer variabilis TaxID=266805 RepID=UPI0003798583|nr:S41 family peptidase [Microbulbifer variabilis]
MGIHLHKLALVGAIALGAFGLAACGSGSSDSEGGATGVENPTPVGGSWEKGNFLPVSTFTDRCVSPRSGTDPITGSAYADVLGTRQDENNWLRSMSNELYLWYDEIEDKDPARFDSSLTYFEELRTFALTPSGREKDRFHFTEPTNEWLSQSESGIYIGYGVQWALISSEPPRKALVAYLDQEDSSLPDAITRGAEVISVDGVDLANGSDVDTLNEGMWPAKSGESHEFKILPLGASDPVTVTLVSAEVESDPVQHVKVETTDSDRKVGYMLFNDHIAKAEGELIDAITELESEGIDDLILDLRYNGGGYLDIAAELAYMIAGDNSVGQSFEHMQFNDQHPEINPVTGAPLDPTPFHTSALGLADDSLKGYPLPTLNLPRLFVLTSGNTCSASEAIINGLRGVDVEVIQIGETTCGKPYGFYPLDNCGTTYFTIQFSGANAKGFGEYSDGFVPNGPFGTEADLPGCEVDDDFDHLLGDVNEARFAAALNYIEGGDCGDVAVKAFSEFGTSNRLLESNVSVPKEISRSNRIMVR